jgi:hypothetical protein
VRPLFQLRNYSTEFKLKVGCEFYYDPRQSIVIPALYEGKGKVVPGVF